MDGGSGLQCQETEGSTEIYPEDVEASGFLQEHYKETNNAHCQDVQLLGLYLNERK